MEKKQIMTYEEAKAFVQKHGIKKAMEFMTWMSRPAGVPSNPWKAYQGRGWTSWPEFLGKKKKPNGSNFLSYDEVKEIIRKKGIKRMVDYRTWEERPSNIPSNPEVFYKGKGWVSWSEFLGNGRRPRNLVFLSYEEARAIVQKQGIKGREEYRKWKKRPLNLPYCPSDVYKNKGWVSWSDFFGNDFTPRVFSHLSYEDAKKIVQKQGVKSVNEYRKWKKSSDIPRNPDRFYVNKGWTSWVDFFGTERKPIKTS
jgi:hypothetical protein